MLRSIAFLFVLTGSLVAQRHELGLTLGTISGPSRPVANGTANLDSGIALQANYAMGFGRTGT